MVLVKLIMAACNDQQWITSVMTDAGDDSVGNKGPSIINGSNHCQ